MWRQKTVGVCPFLERCHTVGRSQPCQKNNHRSLWLQIKSVKYGKWNAIRNGSQGANRLFKHFESLFNRILNFAITSQANTHAHMYTYIHVYENIFFFTKKGPIYSIYLSICLTACLPAYWSIYVSSYLSIYELMTKRQAHTMLLQSINRTRSSAF